MSDVKSSVECEVDQSRVEDEVAQSSVESNDVKSSVKDEVDQFSVEGNDVKSSVECKVDQSSVEGNDVKSSVEARVTAEVEEDSTTEYGLTEFTAQLYPDTVIPFKTLVDRITDPVFEILKGIFNGTIEFSTKSVTTGQISHGWIINPHCPLKCIVMRKSQRTKKRHSTKEYITKYPEDFYFPWTFNVMRISPPAIKLIKLTDLKYTLSEDQYEWVRDFMATSNEKFK
jgi:hypothetical protein